VETPQHLTRLGDLSAELLEDVLELSERVRRRPDHGQLAGRTIGMLFFRGSLRTRASFEAAMNQLGGHAINLTAMSDFWELEDREGVVMDGRTPEHVKDAAAVLSHYVDALAIRPAAAGRSWEIDRRDERIATWRRYSSVPLINMESALWHPQQALGDLVTMRQELRNLKGSKLAITWVHSPEPSSASVVHSLLHAAVRQGMHVHVAHPSGFDLDDGVVSEARELARSSGGSVETGASMEEAAQGARIVYARSWGSLESYGNPTLGAAQRSHLTDWIVDEALMRAGEDAKLMHAMPVRRNVEVVDEVIDGPRSMLYEQAANRLHSQKALLLRLLADGASA